MNATLSAGGQSRTATNTFTVAAAHSARGRFAPGPVSIMASATGAGSLRLRGLGLAGRGGAKSGAVRLSWPANTFGQATVVSLWPAQPAGAKLSAALSLKVTGAAGGDAITRFLAPVKLIFSNVPAGVAPQISANGGGWHPVARLTPHEHLKHGATAYARSGRTVTVSTWKVAFFRLKRS